MQAYPAGTQAQDGIWKTIAQRKPCQRVILREEKGGVWGMGPLSLAFGHLPKDPITI